MVTCGLYCFEVLGLCLLFLSLYALVGGFIMHVDLLFYGLGDVFFASVL